MDAKTFYVGDRPGGARFYRVLDHSGNPYNLTGFTQVQAIMLDSDNREVVFPDDNTAITDASTGRVTFLWPDESVFTKPGRYVMQLKFTATGSTRRTSVEEFNIKALGGATR